MAGWVSTPVGVVQLDLIVQIGWELGAPGRLDLIGWSESGQRFALKDGISQGALGDSFEQRARDAIGELLRAAYP